MLKVKENTITPMKEAPLIKPSSSSKLQKFVEEERQLVKGRFRYFETPGGSTRVQIRKYKELPMFDKAMIDGEVYEIPLYVARHLNGIDVTAGELNGKVGSCSYAVHGFKWNPAGPVPASQQGSGSGGEPGIPVPSVGVSKRVRRFGFESLEFDTGAA